MIVTKKISRVSITIIGVICSLWLIQLLVSEYSVQMLVADIGVEDCPRAEVLPDIGSLSIEHVKIEEAFYYELKEFSIDHKAPDTQLNYQIFKPEPVYERGTLVETPEPNKILVLTSADFGGNNAAIPDLHKYITINRIEYCGVHNYSYMYFNHSGEDLRGRHRSWGKLPGLRAATRLFPDHEWILFLDADIVIMNPSYGLANYILHPQVLVKRLCYGCAWMDNNLLATALKFGEEGTIDLCNIDIIISNDRSGLNTGSFLLRNNKFGRWFIEMWDSELWDSWHLHDQPTLSRLILMYPFIRNHVGLVPQRLLNAYYSDEKAENFRPTDFLVHTAGCWVKSECAKKFFRAWTEREVVHTGRQLTRKEKQLYMKKAREWDLVTYTRSQGNHKVKHPPVFDPVGEIKDYQIHKYII
ncbi:glycosyltransferase family 34 protein [Tortispora caseinolytica NRRL Y-17796]|uniref:Glycosyltransferase family 34 protein n=1 Tax=Tortispora caseinolytica NRRL Y-17796 TaxID=767744 RepID=A0A1E4TCF0_9ASCO|nr:glycosyltransferase family 34 protein [Tortispora caseinolytica NRRL Y-17796]